MKLLKYIFNLVRNTCLIIVLLVASLFTFSETEDWMDYDDLGIGIMNFTGQESNIEPAKLDESELKMRERRLKREKTILKIKGGKAYLNPKDIIYITTDQGQLKFVLQNKEPFTSTDRLGGIAEQLDCNYLHKTKSQIINLEHIQQILSENKSYRSSKNYQSSLVMDNQDTLRISKMHAAEISKIFEQEYTRR